MGPGKVTDKFVNGAGEEQYVPSLLTSLLEIPKQKNVFLGLLNTSTSIFGFNAGGSFEGVKKVTDMPHLD